MNDKIDKSKISVLMPTYNVEQYIEQAVNSILTQTYSNFELIIVDDCSTDKTYEILKQLAEKDSRIKLLRNDTNSKICKTLNRAFKNSTGNYILRMDGDDISEPNRISVLKKYLDENNQIMIVGSQLISIDEKGNEIGRKKYPLNSATIRKCNKFMSSVPHFWMAKRQAYEKLNAYRDIPYAEDYDFLLRGELHNFLYANVPDYLYKCRIRTGNTSSANGLLQRRTAEFVIKQHKKEKKLGHEEFDNKVYQQYLNCSEKQKRRHAEAASWLNKAITIDRHNPKIIFDLIKASIGSKYVFVYLINAAKFRIIIAEENNL